MLKKLADASMRRPRRTGLIALLLLLVTGAVGGLAPEVLKARNDFEDPGSESAAARKQIERASDVQPAPGVLALVEAPPRSRTVAEVARTLDADEDVARVLTYADTKDPRLLSKDGKSTIVAASLGAGAQPTDAAERIEKKFEDNDRVLLGGSDMAVYQINEQASEDLGKAETLVFPLIALLAFLFFRGAAVLLPLTVAILAIFSSFTLLVAINEAVPLSIFALNLVFGLGLGLAVDYSLFLVSRFREELGRGAEVPQAVRTTMATAGRTVLFSAVTVAAASASLIVFPLRFLQSTGIAGVVVSLLSAAVALAILPAVFMLLGKRIGKHLPGPEQEGRWYRVSHGVMRRPGLIAGATAAVLLVAAIPALRAEWTGVDAGALPTSKSAREVNDRVARDFPNTDSTPLVASISAARGAGSQVASYARSLDAVPGVSGVTSPRFVGGGTWQVEANIGGRPVAPPAQEAVERVRALEAPFPVAVGGDAAEFKDQQAALGDNLVLALAILVLTTLVILWVMTGSVILPIKALIMNTLTVGVALGALVFVFQDGRLSDVLSYTSQGGVESADFLVLAAIVFALSTDYGVFLLTRIKEARDSGIDERESVAVGLQRTGRIVTAASALLAVALGAFLLSEMIFLKQLGLGAALAVLVDAFIVRALLVPSLMALLGRWNWWQPRALARLHARLHVDETGAAAREPAATAAA